ncbi:MAG: Na+/H+ antiporter NhaA, partial [Myxococcales bacterium]|nr:Na+/H+ antiporter NhaA [Myxococcales bacterium]
ADLIDRLHPWVAFGIMPVFALANAGVSMTAGGGGGDGVGLAVAAGLVLGKPVGVGLAIAAAVGLGVARLPEGVGPREVLVLGCVAGIGFTMSLFIASLAFTNAALLHATKLGVLVASAIAAAATLLAGRLLLPVRAAPSGDG